MKLVNKMIGYPCLAADLRFRRLEITITTTISTSYRPTKRAPISKYPEWALYECPFTHMYITYYIISHIIWKTDL